MTAAVKIQPQGISVQYPKTQWRVSFVEDSTGKFRFLLCGQDFKFEPRVAIFIPATMMPNELLIVTWNS